MAYALPNHTNTLARPILIDSVPKSGTNLFRNLVLAIPGAQHFPAQRLSFVAESDTDEQRLHVLRNQIYDLRPGKVYAGHGPFSPLAQTWLATYKLKHLFIYRDPRDVAVSVYHFIKKDKQPRHDYYKLYASRTNDYERLIAVIVRCGEGKTGHLLCPRLIPNIRLTYEYLDWLEIDHVYMIQYKDFIDAKGRLNSTASQVVSGLLRFLDFPNDETIVQQHTSGQIG